ncbi:MAG TPA: HNH endonuclease [Pseudonocardiaceae bacterium]|nr:HNH endonuclease [Pseudonocardiaceae bacterium]
MGLLARHHNGLRGPSGCTPRWSTPTRCGTRRPGPRSKTEHVGRADFGWRARHPPNVLCLCPNCHVLFDNGALIIDDDLRVSVNGEALGALRTDLRHVIHQEQPVHHRRCYT